MLALLLFLTGPEWFSRGSELHRTNSYTEAISAFEQSIAARHQIPQSHAMIARALAKLGKIAEAAAELDKAAALEFANLQSVKSDSGFAALVESDRFPAIAAKIEQNGKPCTERPLRRKLDFWVGDWDVTGKAGKPAGSNVIRIAAGGCALTERWTGAAGITGSSVTYYDAGAAQWRQNWVDSGGNNVDFRGEFAGGSLVFRASGQRGTAAFLRKMTFTPMEGGKVRQHGELSTDNGATWMTEYDLTYVRKP